VPYKDPGAGHWWNPLASSTAFAADSAGHYGKPNEEYVCITSEMLVNEFYDAYVLPFVSITPDPQFCSNPVVNSSSLRVDG
jgi:hypothetical protein